MSRMGDYMRKEKGGGGGIISFLRESDSPSGVRVQRRARRAEIKHSRGETRVSFFFPPSSSLPRLKSAN